MTAEKLEKAGSRGVTVKVDGKEYVIVTVQRYNTLFHFYRLLRNAFDAGKLVEEIEEPIRVEAADSASTSLEIEEQAHIRETYQAALESWDSVGSRSDATLYN
ncbi:hypothetical protein [Planctomicrobium piriforme]|uniref:hypothetical protein n=1 Tax=Planctomicrobium piriforme TaxID=1576369 RepID=UPI00111462F7|nr:hypothetical protein [Planctomicrobium piriforme]